MTTTLSIHIQWPQLILLSLLAFELFVTMIKHGQRHSNYNGYYTLGDTIIFLVILYWGGFFS